MHRIHQLPDNLLELKQEELERLFGSGFGHSPFASICKALSLVTSIKHIKTRRPQGIEVAAIVWQLDVDAQTIQAALLSDPRLQESLEHSYIEEHFGGTVANLVRNVNFLNTFHNYSKDIITVPEQAETLRQMLLAMADDVRAVIIKLAYRIQRLRRLPHEDYEIRRYISRETRDIYAPLANRLGIGHLKWELEDLAFRYLEPSTYKSLASSLTENRIKREEYLLAFIEQLQDLLKLEHIKADIFGRPKHIYSIWKKMQSKQVEFDELYDIRAIRILVDKLSTCYGVLGLVHGKWQYIPKQFDDYIANPKANGYQSLHTVVIGPQGALVEIQIRTHDMDQFAELGVASHWRYKEGGKQDAVIEKSIASVRSVLENKQNDETLLQDFHTELYSDRIFVLTPKGELKNLIKGATPIDFAYAIHTEVGHRCRGAKVDGRIVPLSYQLKSGQQVEVLTAKNGGPSRNWINPSMGYLKSSHALAKARTWFRLQDHEKHLQEGKTILEKEKHHLGIQDLNLDDLAKRFHLSRKEELLIRIGRGDITSTQLAGALNIQDTKDAVLPIKTKKQKANNGKGSIQVQGLGNMLTTYAQCCKPVPGDTIIGYITLGKGVTIHRRECSNILTLPEIKQQRLIEVGWGDDEQSIPVKICIDAFDRQGLLRDITQILSHAHSSILDADIHTDRENLSVQMKLSIEVRNSGELSQILDKINQLHNVFEAKREN